MSEESHTQPHDFSPRFISWGSWSITAGALALFLRRQKFLLPLEEKLQEFILSHLVEGQIMIIAPRWCYLAVYLSVLLLLTGVASFYKKPWKTLPQIIVTLITVAALSPILALWNVYFFGASLLFSVMVCSLGAWLTSWFIKDPQNSLLPEGSLSQNK